MPRGKTLRTKKRDAKAVAKATRLGGMEAEAQVFKNKKMFLAWLKHLIELHIDKIPKFTAVIGMTFIIKKLIDTTEELRAYIPRFKTMKFEEVFAFTFPGAPDIPVLEYGKVKDFEGMFPDWQDWLISFTLAYIVVEHAGTLFGMLGDAAGGAVKLVPVLVGLLGG